MEVEVSQLYQRLEEGSYQSSEDDLAYMAIINNIDMRLLPFK